MIEQRTKASMCSLIIVDDILGGIMKGGVLQKIGRVCGFRGRKRCRHLQFHDNNMLTSLEAGQRAIVKDIMGGGKIIARLASMGILPGTEIRVISNAYSGPMTVHVCGGTLSLGRCIAEKVTVD